MKERQITCSMCGTTFDPGGYQACRSCPLQSGCQLVCCPVCGYETVDEEKSTLARWTAILLGKSRRDSSDSTHELGRE